MNEAQNPPSITVRLEHVDKHYSTPAGDFAALTDVSLTLRRGAFAAIVGRSGSGKSTLLNLLAGIDRPSSGTVQVAGARTEAMDETALARWRGAHVGVVFQFFQLLPTLTVLENVVLPMDFAQRGNAEARVARGLSLLKQVGIEEQAHKLPSALSGGQQQRAAIARALANDPDVILADEPTGNLDTETAAAIWDLLRDLAASGKTIVAVTHEPSVASIAGSVIRLVDGRVQGGSA